MRFTKKTGRRVRKVLSTATKTKPKSTQTMSGVSWKKKVKMNRRKDG